MKGQQALDSEIIEANVKSFSSLQLFLLLVLIGVFIGGTTNLINGKVSKQYFQNIMNWDFQGIWIAAVFQGLFEGLIYGIILGLIFTIGFARITKMNVDWIFVKKQLKKIMYSIYISWVIGGLIAIFLAVVFPKSYDTFIYAVPKEILPRIGYAWVGGSIIGNIIGGCISVIWVLINTNRTWRIRDVQKNL